MFILTLPQLREVILWPGLPPLGVGLRVLCQSEPGFSSTLGVGHPLCSVTWSPGPLVIYGGYQSTDTGITPPLLGSACAVLCQN